jgi:hypothetical protein
MSLPSDATGNKKTYSDSSDSTSFTTNTSQVLELTALVFSTSSADTPSQPPASFVNSLMLGRYQTYRVASSPAACESKETTHPSPPASGETQT